MSFPTSTTTSSFRIALSPRTSFLSPQPFSFSVSDTHEPSFRLRVQPAAIMLPSRYSHTMPEWTSPSAYQSHPGYLDAPLNIALFDMHFYLAGNHYVLHHLDYYILQQNSWKMTQYIRAQQDFWMFVQRATDILQWKLLQYTRQLPEHNTLGIPTSEMMERVDQILDRITEEMSSEQYMDRSLKPTVFVCNRLLEDVKNPPPFIPRMTRRYSFP